MPQQEMLILRTISDARECARDAERTGITVGLVPTMGALHEGHLSLIRFARAACDRVIISIFVNPLQFGPAEDFARYPRPFEKDLALAEKEGVDAVFAPEAAEMYPAPNAITVDPGPVGEILEGASRPGHFRGVLTVVAKLFHIVQPNRAYFGQKDAQQAILIRRMAAELNFPLAIEIMPTVRETDGLALSSRNAYLTPEQRRNATVLYRSMRCAESMLHRGVRDGARLEQEMQRMIRETSEAEIDYARMVDPHTLESLATIDSAALAAVAVRFGKTRLIDNLLVVPPSEP